MLIVSIHLFTPIKNYCKFVIKMLQWKQMLFRGIIMEKEKIQRINELAKKEFLTEEEKQEQKQLRQEYIDEYKASLKAQLDNTYIVEQDGTKTKLKKKEN